MRNSLEVGKLVKSKRESANISQTEFASRLGIHKSTLSKYEKGLRNIPMDEIGKMASALNLSAEELLIDRPTVPTIPVKKVPVLSKVSAGIPLYAEENIVDYTYITETMIKHGKEYFGLIVSGDSMDKEFREGDVVIVEKDTPVESGQIGVVMVNGYNATVKRVRYMNDSILLMPESNNPQHEPQMYNASDELCMIGKVVGLNRSY